MKKGAAAKTVRFDNIEEDVIRQRAYYLWEHEGRPQGREAEHWDKARVEIQRELQS